MAHKRSGASKELQFAVNIGSEEAVPQRTVERRAGFEQFEEK